MTAKPTTELIDRLRDCANGMGDFKGSTGDYGLLDDAADALQSWMAIAHNIGKIQDRTRSEIEEWEKVVRDTYDWVRQKEQQYHLSTSQIQVLEAQVEKAMEEVSRANAAEKLSERNYDGLLQCFNAIGEELKGLREFNQTLHTHYGQKVKDNEDLRTLYRSLYRRNKNIFKPLPIALGVVIGCALTAGIILGAPLL